MSEPIEHKFYVKGMHCPSCVVLTEDKLSEHPGVASARASLSELSVTVSVTEHFSGAEAQQIADALTPLLTEHGYSLQLDKPARTIRWSDFRFAFPIAFGIILFFIALQKLGIVNLVQAGKVTYSTAFLVGIVASLSTCMAVVGGIVLSMSATFSQSGQKVKPQLFFHIGRLISFFALGGVIGVIGSTVQLNSTTVFIVDVVIAVVLLILGVNMLQVLPWTQGLQLRMPKVFSKFLFRMQGVNSVFTPFVVGALTFFLPCGFTQSMQIYTLSTGSFVTGALTMLSFALGTLPVLSLLSFTSLSVKKPSSQSVFFKTVGLVVVFFAVFNFLSGLVVLGAIPPIFNF